MCKALPLVTASAMAFAGMAFTPALAAEDILSIIGKDGAVVATFTQAEAEALGTRDIVTTTFWTEGPQRFSGVDAERLLDAAGLSDVMVTAVALDDYAATLSWDDITEKDAIFATRLNGERLTLDNRGPFWIMFDFDSVAEADFGELNSKSVWHLVELEVE